jgi:hypothetical protein
MYNRDLVCETLRWEKEEEIYHVMVHICAENRAVFFFWRGVVKWDIDSNGV